MKTAHTQLVSVRLSFEMISALKEMGDKRDQPWQTVMKAMLSESLGLNGEAVPKKSRAAEKRLYSASHVKASTKRLQKR